MENKPITQFEIDTFARGKNDAKLNSLLKVASINKILNNPRTLKAFMTAMSNGSDVEVLSMKYDLSTRDMRSLLEFLHVQNASDARKYIEQYLTEDKLQADLARRKAEAEAQDRMYKNSTAPAPAEKTLEERQAEAQHKNKMERVRDLLEKQKNKRELVIPKEREQEFRIAVMHGLQAVKSRFGNVTRENVVVEAKRLIPDFDEGLLGQ